MIALANPAGVKTSAAGVSQPTASHIKIPPAEQHRCSTLAVPVQNVVARWAWWMLLMIGVTPLQAQPFDELESTTITNLADALPPSSWTRVESSVDRGLRYLASTQAEDGRFPSNSIAQPGVTALSIMAFLSRGHMPDRGQYGTVISNAIEFVLSTQRRRGYFSLEPVIPPATHLTPSQTVTYNHSIAGLMLGEVYGMTDAEQSSRIEEAITRALIYHREVQSRTKEHEADAGGWRYGYPESPQASSDMSVTGWGLMFLRSAKNAEFDVPKQYFDEGLDFVSHCYEPDESFRDKGVFRYRPRESQGDGNPQITLANTSSATLTLILGGRQDHPGVQESARWLREQSYPKPWQNNYFYLATYYSSQAAAQVGEDTWTTVFPQIAANLLDEQSDTGGWPPGGSNENLYGSTYSTSLAILALTPAYQLLPIYQR